MYLNESQIPHTYMCTYFYQNGIYNVFQQAWTQTCTEKGCSKRINRNYAYGDQFQYTIHKAETE